MVHMRTRTEVRIEFSDEERDTLRTACYGDHLSDGETQLLEVARAKALQGETKDGNAYSANELSSLRCAVGDAIEWGVFGDEYDPEDHTENDLVEALQDAENAVRALASTASREALHFNEEHNPEVYAR